MKKYIIELNGKIEVVTGQEYLLVIKDEKGTCHFWKKDGSYDGSDSKCK